MPLNSGRETGERMHALVRELYPICRSITGEGLRQTLRIIREQIPMDIHEVPSGTKVFDWEVPKEWNIRNAYIKDPRGRKVVDFRDSNLHVVSYSIPVKKKMDLSELKRHLHSLPDRPDWIPYRTSYYEEAWGFCLSHRQLERLEPGEYEVFIDSELRDGHMSYGECCIAGAQDEEVLITCNVCHPSLCNENLTSVAVMAGLAQNLQEEKRRLTYRFLFLPATIGPITWLSRNEDRAMKILSGLCLSCLGDSGQFHYKRSRRLDAMINGVVEQVLRESGEPHTILPFTPYGYDERQFCSPGFNLPVGHLSRSPHGSFPEYHTSADNMEFVKPRQIEDSFAKCLEILNLLDVNETYVNQNPKCEPQLGRRGLYKGVGGRAPSEESMAVLWVLNFSDGGHSLLEIAGLSGLPFAAVHRAAELLKQHNLLAPPASRDKIDGSGVSARLAS